MYVFVCPCIQNPSLRAEGITTGSDIHVYSRAVERCQKFGIEMVLLPCPETLYLGERRKPGTFLERLNTSEFECLLDVLESRVHEVIAKRAPPACIIGVNSSPTCGVTTTYYGDTGDGSLKKEGRGVFLARFPDIPATDVADFAKYRIYLAAPLFSEAERSYNTAIADLLKNNLFDVYMPQETGDDSHERNSAEHQRIYKSHKKALHDADVVVAIIDGADADSGTAWEMGYAAALGKPVFALRTDFRRAGTYEHVNLMLEQSATVVLSRAELLARLKSPLLLG